MNRQDFYDRSILYSQDNNNCHLSFTTKSFEFLDYTEICEDLNLTIFETRNNPEIRRFLTNPNIIKFADHKEFISRLKSHHDTQSYYAVLLDGNYCGSVNLKRINKDTIERGIFIHPNFQNRGLAKKISIEFYSYLFERKGIKYVKTSVMKDNIPSLALQTSLGAKLLESDERYNHYILDIGDIVKNNLS